MRRLFWTFAPGVPGAGLLVMRLVTATALAATGMGGLSAQLTIASAVFLIVSTCSCLLLLIGLWTPVAGALVVVLEISRILSHPEDPWTHILIATLGGALALVGPGAWSVDARLFGWKRIDIKDRQTRADTYADPRRP